jgi:outer membrane murein-binding lipoprotein Lpp
MAFTFTGIILASGGFVIAVTQTAPPDLTGIAAIITAGIGVVAFLATFLRGRRNNQRVQEVEQAASYVKGFDALIKRLESEIKQLRNDHDSESRRWQTEKENLRRTIDRLRSELKSAIADNLETRGHLAELRGQIRGFLNEQQYEEFQKHLK